MEHLFGAILQKKDERDYDLTKLGSVSVTPKVFRPDYSKVAVRHQHKQPACGSHAGAVLEGILSLIKKEEGYDNSPRFLWKYIKDIDGYAIEVGTDLYSIMRQLKNVGVSDISELESDVSADTLSLTDYRNPTITELMKATAKDRQISTYAFKYSPTFQQIKDAIYQNGAIIIQYRCGENMYKGKNGKTSWLAKDIMPLNPDRYPIDSGHFVVGIGFDEKYIYFRNSWGDTWGEKGDGWFGEDYTKLVYCIGTAVDADKLNPDMLPKYTFNKDLTTGSTGADVVALQKLLVALKLLVMPKGVAYGYYGEITKQAVKKLQEANADAILYPVALTKGTGYFGIQTRKFINQKYGLKS